MPVVVDGQPRADAKHVVVVAEVRVRPVDDAVHLDAHVVWRVHHDLGEPRVLQQLLERSKSVQVVEGRVGDGLQDLVALAAEPADAADQLADDLSCHPLVDVLG